MRGHYPADADETRHDPEMRFAARGTGTPSRSAVVADDSSDAESVIR
jgi:hypothetical protein